MMSLITLPCMLSTRSLQAAATRSAKVRKSDSTDDAPKGKNRKRGRDESNEGSEGAGSSRGRHTSKRTRTGQRETSCVS